MSDELDPKGDASLEAVILNKEGAIKMPGRDDDAMIDLTMEALPTVQDQVPAKAEVKSGFQPKGKVAQAAAAGVKDQSSATIHTSDEQVTVARIRALEIALQQLRQGMGGAKIAEREAKPPILDFSNITEKDVFDLNVPIQAIVMDIPEYVNVDLKDTNYIARWVHKSGRRQGQMKNFGFTYVVEEDLATPLLLVNAKNENGQFTLDDVILMKCPKQKYYGVLRRNMLRAQSRVNPKDAHKAGKQLIEADLKGVSSADFAKYSGANQLNVYSPFEI